jgi:hypothetical protein
MFGDHATQRVEITFEGAPPTRQVMRASGVSDVEVDGHTLRCRVTGSFQPLLDAVRGYEVLTLESVGDGKGGPSVI